MASRFRICAGGRSRATAPTAIAGGGACMVEVEGRGGCWPPAASASRATAWWCGPSRRGRPRRGRMVFELLAADQPARTKAHDPDSAFWRWADEVGVAESRFPPCAPRCRRVTPAIRRCGVNLDACIECTGSVSVPCRRGPGQRRDRHGRPRRRLACSVRLRRPDGQLDLRRLRRMRPGLSDRRG